MPLQRPQASAHVHFASARSPPPYKVRSQSSSSTDSSSSSGSQSPIHAVDLHERAISLLDILYNKHDLRAAAPLIHPNVTTSHNDDATLHNRDEFLAYWARRTKKVPGLRAKCRECAVDEAQRKVWVVSELYTKPGEEGRRRESVDMLWFDEEGVLIGESDWVRCVRRRDDEEE
jgi:hypothetical protein